MDGGYPIRWSLEFSIFCQTPKVHHFICHPFLSSYPLDFKMWIQSLMDIIRAAVSPLVGETNVTQC
jgi:hypothetical protein